MNRKLVKFIRQYSPRCKFIKKYMVLTKLHKINEFKLSQSDVVKGENGEEQKSVILENFYKTHPKAKSMISTLIKKYKENYQIEELDYVEIAWCYFAYGFMPDEFIFFDLKDKTCNEINSYWSDRDQNDLVYRLNDIIDMDILLDKYKTYKKFKKYYCREAILIRNYSDKKIFDNFCNKYKKFVQKQVEMSRGNSVKLVTINEKNKDSIFQYLVKHGPYILEEVIEASDTNNVLNPSSINTVRCETINLNGEVSILFTFMRVGQGGTFVDNGGQGGILIGINKENGCLETDGIDEKGKIYYKHPETGVIFRNFQLPEWSNLLEMVREMARSLPTVRLIGWDMAYSKQGWVLVEGNNGGQAIGPQLVYNKGIRELMEKCKII